MPRWTPTTQGRPLLCLAAAIKFVLGSVEFYFFHCEAGILHNTCDTKSDCCQGPYSCSIRLCQLVHSNYELEPLYLLYFIHICKFRLCVFTFLLVFVDSYVGKAFLARSIIVVCMVCNQRSTGITVAGIPILLD